MINVAIYDMSISELENLIQLKELEYTEAFKKKKVFWEIRNIVDQKRQIEKQLLKKQSEVFHTMNSVAI